MVSLSARAPPKTTAIPAGLAGPVRNGVTKYAGEPQRRTNPRPDLLAGPGRDPSLGGWQIASGGKCYWAWCSRLGNLTADIHHGQGGLTETVGLTGIGESGCQGVTRKQKLSPEGCSVYRSGDWDARVRSATVRRQCPACAVLRSHRWFNQFTLAAAKALRRRNVALSAAAAGSVCGGGGQSSSAAGCLPDSGPYVDPGLQ